MSFNSHNTVIFVRLKQNRHKKYFLNYVNNQTKTLYITAYNISIFSKYEKEKL